MGRSWLSGAGPQWPPAQAFLPSLASPSHDLSAAQESLGTSGFLRGCFPHFWKPTVVCFSVVKALAGAQPSGRAGDWERPEPRAHSLSAPTMYQASGIHRRLKQFLAFENFLILLWIRTGNMRSSTPILYWSQTEVPVTQAESPPTPSLPLLLTLTPWLC